MKHSPSQKERGFRRLTVGVSLAILCAGLTLTARDAYRMMVFSNRQTREAECRNSAGSDQKAKAECEHVSLDDYLSRPVSFSFDVLETFGEAALPQSTLFFDVFVFLATHLLAFTVGIGLVLSLVLAALPWTVFYFTRWIARGFDGAQPPAAS